VSYQDVASNYAWVAVIQVNVQVFEIGRAAGDCVKSISQITTSNKQDLISFKKQVIFNHFYFMCISLKKNYDER